MPHIHFIVNPSSGPGSLQVKQLEDALSKSEASWKIHVTEKAEDLRLMPEQALKEGANIIVACGGDGTVSEVAQQLVGTNVALGIIPTGTANVLAAELGIPSNPLEAAALITSPTRSVRCIDVGKVHGKYFFLRIGFGLEAAMTRMVEKDLKQKIGRWAYLLTALRLRREIPRVKYYLSIDGKRFKRKGVTCMVCNSANVGIQGVKFLNSINLSDGLLHVVILRNAGMKTIITLIRHMVISLFNIDYYSDGENHIGYWTGKKINITCTPSQVVARDGEPIEDPLPLQVEVIPAAMNVLVPQD